VDEVAAAFKAGDIERSRNATIKLVYASRVHDIVMDIPSEVDH